MKKLIAIFFILTFCINVSAAASVCDYLSKAIAAEMGEEPFVVRVIFGEMLLNRLYDENYPDTLPAICFSLGIRTNNVTVTGSDRRAAAAALCGMNFSCGALNANRYDKRHMPPALDGICLYGWIFY